MILPRARARATPGDGPAPAVFSRAQLVLLACITLVAAALRLTALGTILPGINQDEAIGAWITRCLLVTGRDLVGQPWPVFYSHGIGDNPSMLFFWVLLPFQALLGMDVWTTRLPGALAGTLLVPLVAWCGARLVRPSVGLAAAALLALNIWAVSLSRLGVGATLCPLQALLPVALLIAAGAPLADASTARVRPLLALLAGLTAGIACWGFHPMRLYFPPLFLLLALVHAGDVRRTLATPGGRRSALLFALALGATAGPLVWRHAVDPAIAQRWEMTRLWQPDDSPLTIVALVARRFLVHFGPEFLLLTGDGYPATNPTRTGVLGPYLSPFLVAGLGLLLWRARRSRSARTLLVLLIVYPAGDLVSYYKGVHALRSAPGQAALVLLAAYGVVESVAWYGRRSRAIGVALVGLLFAAAVFFDAAPLVRYFRDLPRDPWMRTLNQADLLAASRWLRPRLDDVDAVFCSAPDMNQPFAVMLVGLDYDPRRWLAEPRERTTIVYDEYFRFGEVHFLPGGSGLEALRVLRENGKDDRVIWIVRPGTLPFHDPVFVRRGPDGAETLWVCRVVM